MGVIQMDSPVIKEAKMKSLLPNAFRSDRPKAYKSLLAMQRYRDSEQFGVLPRVEPRRNFLVQKPLKPNTLDVKENIEENEKSIPKNKRFSSKYYF